MATKMAEFFRTIHTLGQFRQAYPEVSVPDAIALAQRLVQENLLEFVVTYNSGAGEAKAYKTYRLPPEKDIAYGVIDCLVFGFAYVRERFKRSVIPLLVNGELGTGFLVEGNQVLTAAHCLTDPQPPVHLTLVNSPQLKVMRAVVPKDQKVDVGALVLMSEIPHGARPLRIGTAGILDDVLALGYPPIPGFLSVLVAQTARVAGHLEHLHSTTGEIVDRQRSYLVGDRLLISARVKGGSSGGPVINRSGKVIGIVSASPVTNYEEVDKLGFGVAIPSEVIELFLSNVRLASEEVREVPFSQGD